MAEDLFDLTNVDDLPEGLKEAITARRGNETTSKFLEELSELFTLARRPLTISELLVAFYRKYNKVYKRHALMNYLYKYARQKDSGLKQINSFMFVHKSALLKKDFDAIKKYVPKKRANRK